jgi:CO/xanthine dehydrogenase FAD-binding subunit
LIELYRDDGIEYLTKQRDEVLTEILIPASSDSEHCRSSFWKLRRRGSIDFSVFSVATAVWTDSSGSVTRAAMYLGAVESRPISVDGIDIAIGKTLDEPLIAEIAHQARQIATPMDNTDFTPSWRGKMVEQYAEAALREIAGLPVRRISPHHGLTVV